MRWWPRSIRWQMLAGLLLFEVLSIGLFAALLMQQHNREASVRAQHRLAHQASSVAMQAQEAMTQQRPDWVGLSVKIMDEAPSVSFAKVTDPAGNVLFTSQGEANLVTLTPQERAQIPLMTGDQSRVFNLGNDIWEGAIPIRTGADLRGFAWVETDPTWDHEQLYGILRVTALFSVIWIAASVLLVLLASRSISRPLAILHRGTRALINSSESAVNFPLPGNVHNEFGELIQAFNHMVASIEEQRSGLNDTLSLLDSMLANAPVGLAFFDRRCRFVRVNQVFAEMTGVSLSRHLGRTVLELLPLPVAKVFEETVLRVFDEEEPVRNLELNGPGDKFIRPWTWLASAYPVWTTPRKVRWVGVIVLDASDRKRSEEALRKTEKLAATGRLAASIAHEINNPLAAITNLLFLLRDYCQLQGPALNYVKLAEQEVKRVAEITQQTLGFYRQTSQAARARVSDLLDSVLGLYNGRLNALNMLVEREYDPEVDLFCLAGEIRQVLANLVSNAIDASSMGGRLVVHARRSRNWSKPAQTGVRFTVADTGSGMEPAVRERVFEAFYTTKEVTGTGLGLWVSHEIIAKHGGCVHVRSRASDHSPSIQQSPHGTVFQLFIPDGPAVAAEIPQPVAVAG